MRQAHGAGACEKLLSDKLKLEAGQAEAVCGQLRRRHVPTEERVVIDAPEKTPERPNVFKRWLSRFNQSWREQNERYESYVREQQTARLRQRSALDDATAAIPTGWANGEKTTLREYIEKYTKVARNAETAYDRETSSELIFQAVKHAAAVNSGANAAMLPDTVISPDALDVRQAMKDPVLNFMRINRNAALRQSVETEEPCKAILMEIGKVGKAFTVTPEEMKRKQAQMKQLYNAMNVPDLESRSLAYQEMVASVGKLALREDPSVVDSIRVFNSVQSYANQKNDVPSTEQGRESLALAYRALKTVIPEGERGTVLIQPMQLKMAKLERAMHPKAPEPEPTLQ